MVLGGMTTDNRGVVGTAPIVGDLNMAAFNILFTTGYLAYTDIAMLDYKCAACGNEFKEGDDVVLRVRKIIETKDTKKPVILTVPVHAGKCKFKKGINWTLKME